MSKETREEAIARRNAALEAKKLAAKEKHAQKMAEIDARAEARNEAIKEKFPVKTLEEIRAEVKVQLREAEDVRKATLDAKNAQRAQKNAPIQKKETQQEATEEPVNKVPMNARKEPQAKASETASVKSPKSLKSSEPTVANTEKSDKAELRRAKKLEKTHSKVNKMLEDISSNLSAGELILDHVQGSIVEPSALGLLILTNKRFRFAWEISWPQRSTMHEDYFLEDIKTVSQNLKKVSGFYNSRLWIRIGKKTSYFSSNLDKIAEFNEFAHRLNDEVLRTKKRGSPNLDEAKVSKRKDGNESIDSQLEKLVSMHERGLLSESEFATAKSRLLGLS